MSCTIGILTLGCRVNQYESSSMAKLLIDEGFQVRPFDSVCDAYIINTCTVTAESDRKSRQALRRAMAKNPNALTVACGCSCQLSPDTFSRLAANGVFGVRNKLQCIEFIKQNIAAGQAVREINVPDASSLPYEKMTGAVTERTRAYVKIQDGCNGKCAYCAIKNARGSSVSNDENAILSEVRSLAGDGFCEIVLTGIETSAYGADTGSSLHALVHKVAEVDGIRRIRLGSLDPSYFKRSNTQELLGCDKLCGHFHLSVQSASSHVLAAMRRTYNGDMLRRNIEDALTLIPELRFSCDIITGFPGERESDVEQTARLLTDYPFIHAHVFPYSERKGTEAASMPDALPVTERKARGAYLDGISRRRLCDILQRDVDEKKVHSVLFETYADGILHGHSRDFTQVEAVGTEDMKGRILPVISQRHKNGILFGVIAEER